MEALSRKALAFSRVKIRTTYRKLDKRMDLKELVSINKAIAFESDAIALLKNIVGKNSVILDEKDMVYKSHHSLFNPDIVIKKDTYANLLLFKDTSKELLVEICYRLTSVKLNRIIGFCNHPQNENIYNYLIICKRPL